MKKTINGFRFNTAIAIPIGTASHGANGSWSAWEATMYRTPRIRRFFLAGKGGLMTRFIGRERIIPMTEDDAKEWTFRHVGMVAAVKHFTSGGDLSKLRYPIVTKAP